MQKINVTTVSAVATSATAVQAVIPEFQKSKAVKRFTPLTDPDTPLLPKFESALFYYVLSELCGYTKDAVQQKSALALANQHFDNALACETGGDACDDVCIPIQSFANG